MIKFTWDPRKDKANQKKHGVSFEEAKSVFFDENAIQFYDDSLRKRGPLYHAWDEYPTSNSSRTSLRTTVRKCDSNHICPERDQI
jgi:uncharacterized DUF497 family protein